MDKTVQLARQNGVRVGAHPSLPDRQGFGRREMSMEPVETRYFMSGWCIHSVSLG